MLAYARIAATDAFDNLTEAATVYVVESYRAELLRADDDVRSCMTDDKRNSRERRLRHRRDLDGLRGAFDLNDLTAQVRVYGDDVRRFAAQLGLCLDMATPAFRRLCRELLSVDCAVAELILEHDRGYPVPTPVAPIAIAPQRAAQPTMPVGRTLDALIDAFTKDRIEEGTWSTATAASYRPVFRLLRGILGDDTGITAISRDDARRVRQAAQALPSNLGKIKALNGLTIPEAIETGKTLGLSTIGPKTVNDAYLSQCSCLFRWAVLEQWLVTNPFTDLSVSDPVAAADKRDAFTMPQLKTLLATAPWGDRDVTGGGRPVRFWAVPIALFHGMRRAEIMQLRVADVEVWGGVPVMSIRGKQLKTKNARRIMPIHPEVQRMGFMAFVDQRRESGADLLFPDEGPNPRGQWGDGFSKWFQRLLEPLRFQGTKLGFHSFRHNFQDRLREADLHGTGIAQVLAARATSGDVSSNYGLGYGSATLTAAIRKIAYPELDPSHLYTDR
ncbi:MAG: site-specific integrase [Janthinobacterium lividum]